MGNDNINLVQGLLLLGLLLTAFIASNRYKDIPVIKYVAYWLGIFLLLGILYSYRDVFIDVKERFMSNLLPGYQIHKDGEIIVKRAEDGHFYLFGKINGHRTKFMVDTGASRVVLSRHVADDVGIDLSKLKFVFISYTANGEVRTARYSVDEFQIGDLVLYNFSVDINDTEMDISLLGMSFLEKLKYYKFDGDELHLKY